MWWGSSLKPERKEHILVRPPEPCSLSPTPDNRSDTLQLKKSKKPNKIKAKNLTTTTKKITVLSSISWTRGKYRQAARRLSGTFLSSNAKFLWLLKLHALWNRLPDLLSTHLLRPHTDRCYEVLCYKDVLSLYLLPTVTIPFSDHLESTDWIFLSALDHTVWAFHVVRHGLSPPGQLKSIWTLVRLQCVIKHTRLLSQRVQRSLRSCSFHFNIHSHTRNSMSNAPENP